LGTLCRLTISANRPDPKARNEAEQDNTADRIVRGTSNQKGTPVDSDSTKCKQLRFKVAYTSNEMHAPGAAKFVNGFLEEVIPSPKHETCETDPI